MMKIVEAERSDLDEIMEIERSVFSVPWSENNMLFEIDSGDAFVGLAKDNGRIIGFVVMHGFTDEAEIFNIAVKEEYRRRKTGTALLHAAFSRAEEAGYEKLYLEVRAGNTAAIDMYLKNGFILLGVRKDYYDYPKEDALIMTRDMKRGNGQ